MLRAKIRFLLKISIIILIAIQGRLLFAQEDSLLISPVPLTEIATTAATDLQNTRNMLLQRIQVHKAYSLLPMVDSLEFKILELKELSDQKLRPQLEYAYYNSMILRWERFNSRIDPLQDILKKYAADMHGIRTELVISQSKWEITMLETDTTVLTADIVSRINGASR